MNKQHFAVVAGHDVEEFLEEQLTAERARQGFVLTRWQEEVHRNGYVAAELCKSMHGWTLRYATGLMGFGIIQATKNFDWPHAVNVAKQWQERDPVRRYVFVRRAELMEVAK
jgi:hypothetical protein